MLTLDFEIFFKEMLTKVRNNFVCPFSKILKIILKIETNVNHKTPSPYPHILKLLE